MRKRERQSLDQPVCMDKSVEAQPISPAGGEVGDVDTRVSATTTQQPITRRAYSATPEHQDKSPSATLEHQDKSLAKHPETTWLLESFRGHQQPTTWLLESFRGHQQPTTWLLGSFNSELSQAGTYNTAKYSHPKTLAYSKSVLTNWPTIVFSFCLLSIIVLLQYCGLTNSFTLHVPVPEAGYIYFCSCTTTSIHRFDRHVQDANKTQTVNILAENSPTVLSVRSKDIHAFKNKITFKTPSMCNASCAFTCQRPRRWSHLLRYL